MESSFLIATSVCAGLLMAGLVEFVLQRIWARQLNSLDLQYSQVGNEMESIATEIGVLADWLEEGNGLPVSDECLATLRTF